MGGEITEGCQPHILATKSFSPHIKPKTKGLEESLTETCSFVTLGFFINIYTYGFIDYVTRNREMNP